MKKYILYFIAVISAILAFICQYFSFYGSDWLLLRWVPVSICLVLLIVFCFRRKNEIQWIILLILVACIPLYIFYVNWQEKRLNYLLYDKPCNYNAYYSQGFTTVSVTLYSDHTFLADESTFVFYKRYTGTYRIGEKELVMVYDQHKPQSYILLERYVRDKDKVLFPGRDTQTNFLYLYKGH